MAACHYLFGRLSCCERARDCMSTNPSEGTQDLQYLQDNTKDRNRQQCSGMYSKKSWGGDIDPYILASLTKASPEPDQDVFVSLVVFEYRDEDMIGVWPSPDSLDVS